MGKPKNIIVGPAFPLRGGIANFNNALCKAFINEGIYSQIYSFSLQYPSFLFPGKTQFENGKPPKGFQIKTIINSINKFNDRMDTDEDYANRYADFVYYMKRSKADTKHDKAIKVLELLEGKPTIGGRLNVIKKLLTDGSKVV